MKSTKPILNTNRWFKRHLILESFVHMRVNI
jgi:hypothetical protein